VITARHVSNARVVAISERITLFAVQAGNQTVCFIWSNRPAHALRSSICMSAVTSADMSCAALLLAAKVNGVNSMLPGA